MRLLLTGATGFIGSRLARRAVREGHAVHALLRRGGDVARLPAGVTAHHDDGALDVLLSALAPDAVLHLATRYQHGHAHADIAPMLEANLLFGARLADAAARAGVRGFVTLGTGAQFAGRDHAEPASLYAASKQAFETLLAAIARGSALRTATLVVFDTFGEGDTRGKILDRMIAAARSGTPLDLSPGEQAIDLVHVEDVVDAVLMAAAALISGDLVPGGRFVLSSGETVTLRGLAGRVEVELGRPVPARWGALPYRAGEIMQPWRGGTPLPGWRARRVLDDHLATCSEPMP